MKTFGPPHAAPPMARSGGADGPVAPARPDGRGAVPSTPATIGSVAVLLLVEYSAAGRWWGWLRMAWRRLPLRGMAGLRFSKILGSGHEGGFGLRPSGTRQGLFLGFDDEVSARAFLAASPLLAAYRAHARECCTVLLRCASAKGSWDGATMLPTATLPPHGPIAALTRASIRPRHLVEFWRHTPGSEASLEASAGCRLSAGLGEAPLLRQCTFSLWDSVAAMDAYARSGAHLQAIRASYAGDYFSESMFLRFAVLELRGRWKGRDHGG